MVAVVAEDYVSNQRSVVVCGLKGNCKTTALNTDIQDTNARFRIQWKEGRVFVTNPEYVLPSTTVVATWSLHPGDAQAITAATPPDLMPNVYDTPLSYQNKIQQLGGDKALNLLKQVQKLGGVEPDFWCEDCGLAKLPREAPMQ